MWLDWNKGAYSGLWTLWGDYFEGLWVWAYGIFLITCTCRNFWQIINTSSTMLSFTISFSKSALLIHRRAPNTIHFYLYISIFLHDLSILQKKKKLPWLNPQPSCVWKWDVKKTISPAKTKAYGKINLYILFNWRFKFMESGFSIFCFIPQLPLCDVRGLLYSMEHILRSHIRYLGSLLTNQNSILKKTVWRRLCDQSSLQMGSLTFRWQ